MTPPVVFHPDYEISVRPGHPFPMSKYGYLRRRLAAEGLLGAGDHVRPGAAPVALLRLAHEAGYVDRALTGRLAPEEIRRIGFPASEAAARRARRASAGTLLAARLALETGLAINAAGGAHHAARGHGAGYCLFNDVAVAAAALIAEGAAGRILVLDLDVHQGDGTARIFRGEPCVFTASLHAARNFPARKAGSDIDVALPDGADDAAYLEALDAMLGAIEGRFEPDLVFYNAGVDPHRDDRLGRLALSDEGLSARDARALSWARRRGVPVAAVLGGGYADHPETVAARHLALFREAARFA